MALGIPPAVATRSVSVVPAPLRLLQVSAFFPAHGGGIEVVAGALAEGLAARGVHVYWMAGGEPGDLPVPTEGSGLTAEHARSIDFLERRLGLPMPLWGLAGLLRLWRAVKHCDLVHVHDYLYQPTLLAMCFAVLRGKPWLVTQHVGDIAFRSAGARQLLRALNGTLGRLVLSFADQVAFVGRPVQEYFLRFTRFKSPPMLVPNGVDHRLFQPNPRRKTEAEVELLFVGRFVEKKGVVALRACMELPGARWTLVGWGPEPPCDAANERIRLPGRLPPSEVAKHYQAADLLVLPSTGEGFPLVVQEALACGTPVLVSREVAEAFPSLDKDCVFSVELRGVDASAALRQALNDLIADPGRLARARAAAVRLSEQWSWDRCADTYLGLYDRLLHRGPNPSNP